MSQSPALASYLVFQAENNAWSNHRLHAACAALPPEAYFAKRPCFFGSIHNTLHHLLLVDHRYMERIEGRLAPDALPDELPHGDLAVLTGSQRTADRRLIALVERAWRNRCAFWTRRARPGSTRFTGCSPISSSIRCITAARFTTCCPRPRSRRRSSTSSSSPRTPHAGRRRWPHSPCRSPPAWPGRNG